MPCFSVPGKAMNWNLMWQQGLIVCHFSKGHLSFSCSGENVKMSAVASKFPVSPATLQNICLQRCFVSQLQTHKPRAKKGSWICDGIKSAPLQYHNPQWPFRNDGISQAVHRNLTHNTWRTRFPSQLPQNNTCKTAFDEGSSSHNLARIEPNSSYEGFTIALTKVRLSNGTPKSLSSSKASFSQKKVALQSLCPFPKSTGAKTMLLPALLSG